MTNLKRTPLFPEYEKHGAKTIDFGGWAMPVQFSGIKKEHEATRTTAGLFDVSHMGEIVVEGKDSEAFLQSMLTNDIAKLQPNKAQYSLMCYENGGTVDDLIVYKIKDNDYLLVVNASNTDKDFDWLVKHKQGDVHISNVSLDYVQVAIQGPKAEQILQTLTDTVLEEIKFFNFRSDVSFTGIQHKAIVSRTGYTGEDGFEIYIDADSGQQLWNTILQAGEPEGLHPIGLGARDTLRFEATLPLYGQEIDEEITPIEAGLGFAVKVDKTSDFIGKKVLLQQKQKGPKRKLVGIEMIEKGIPRHGYHVFSEDKEIGVITTGTQSPTLQKNIGLALIDSKFAEEGQELIVHVRKKKLRAIVVSTPFYKRS
ncbi:glycine cleavage system aminomethyltransferase GcvT [Aquibacillus koreensis]|uniref:Aminomethyltransferase n=1 Tax=Aquibacillus koreensis TaxID=279446 RepID=A0A9X4AGE6_9BACI|nr:glycine cleavage system aminomethyltransferase GcvT [Aquibacillus koreensis]MCT2537541.1 glycine cleavage system aminomethyltransferase GcvT [Aquibacillus koreensis]MDC3418987.1 glycine cleavage system aminomethyltransferase GcvT [Aquibacillus koreensis]